MKNKNFSISRLLKSNRFVLVISLIAAIAIWVTVSPNREASVNVTVNIDTANTSLETLGLEVIEGQGQSVSVSISGKWYIISEITDKDIRISYSLSDITKAGEKEIALSALKATGNGDYEILKVTPEKIKVKFDYIYTRSFKIEPQANNIKAKDGYIADAPVIDTDSSIIDITGPMSIVEKISSVVAKVDDRATLSASASYTASLTLLDKDGKKIDDSSLTLPFKDVGVTVPIIRSKTLPIEIAFANAPEYYQKNPLPYALSVKKVNVIGTAEVVDSMDKIVLETIDFSTISDSNKKFTYNLALPSGVKTVDDIGPITVTIDTSSIKTKKLTVTSFKAVGGDENTAVKVITASKSVTVVGASSVISKITAADVVLQCDLSDIGEKTGEIVVNATLKSTKYNNIWGYGRYQLQIKVG